MEIEQRHTESFFYWTEFVCLHPESICSWGWWWLGNWRSIYTHDFLKPAESKWTMWEILEKEREWWL